MDEAVDIDTVEHRQWKAWEVLLAGISAVVVLVGVILVVHPTRTIEGRSVVSQPEVAGYLAEKKAADDAATAKEAADAAAKFLALTETNVKSSMQEYINDPSNGLSTLDIVVYDVTLISVGNNKYEGDAEMSANGGTHKQILVHVIADQENTQWQTDKGGLLPLFN